MSERKDFKKRDVSRKYLEQDGVCANPLCMNPLNKGFHRHHADGDHENNTYENLQLLCMECHHAKKDKEGLNRLEAHRKVEREVFSLVAKMINTAFESKMSGANMERMLDGFTRMLQISRREKGLDVETEYPPTEIKMILSQQIANEKLQDYLSGVKDGIRMITIHVSEPEK